MEKVENFPTSKNQLIFFQNLMNWNICSRGNFSGKSENFPLFQFFRKLRNFIHPGLKVCQFSDRLEKVEIFPIKSDELEHLLKVENFPIWKHRKIFFQNLINWNICSCGKISDKSENFPLFQLLRKIFHFANFKKKYGQKHDFLSKNRKIPEKQKKCELFEIFYIK